MATSIRKKIMGIFKTKKHESHDESVIFTGSTENFMVNGAEILERCISLFHGKTNPIRCFSVNELNSMNLVKGTALLNDEKSKYYYECVWEGRFLLVKVSFNKWDKKYAYQDLVLHTRMMSHPNIHKLIRCCLDTEYPVIVYEWGQYDSLRDRVLMTNVQNKKPLEWKIRIKIAWQIVYVLAYLHTAFHRPIIYRNLNLGVVFLDQDNNTVKLKDFYFAIQIPEGEEFAESYITGTLGYIAPEYIKTGRITEKVDVYAFGVIFLVLLTGENPSDTKYENLCFAERIRDEFQDEDLWDIIYRSMLTNKVLLNEHLKDHILQILRVSMELSLRCIESEEDNRPSMVEAGEELRNIIKSSESISELEDD